MAGRPVGREAGRQGESPKLTNNTRDQTADWLSRLAMREESGARERGKSRLPASAEAVEDCLKFYWLLFAKQKLYFCALF